MRALLILFAFLLLPLSARAQDLPDSAYEGHYYNVEKTEGKDQPAAAQEAPADPQPTMATAFPKLDGQLPPTHTVVVTSLGKCYAALGRKEEYEIRRNFVKPYEECERRLALKRKKEQTAKAGDAPKEDAKSGDKTPDSAIGDKKSADSGFPRGIPHGFYRAEPVPLPIAKPDEDKEKKPQYNQ